MKGWEMFLRASRRIPGGTQLLSKRPAMYLPEYWPSYFARAKGVEVTDLDGRTFTDMSMMGIGTCVLGYADPEVDAAVKAAIDQGVASTLNCAEEVELADLLVELHPWAQMVRYARGGGEAMAMAVRIARAHTRRDKVAFCGYHGWADWYLAANLAEDEALDAHLLPGLEPRGVPRGLTGTALPFHYNRIDQLQTILRENPGQLAAIVMEPQRGSEPAEGFLQQVRSLADSIGAVLVFDEITTGFRMTDGGIHMLWSVTPDMAVFAKGIANGYAMSVVLGREEVMQAAQSTFISSTNWTERIGPVAALATIAKFRREKVAQHLIGIGGQVMEGWVKAAGKAGLKLNASGLPSLCQFAFEDEQELALTTLFIQMMLERGYLTYNQFKPSFSHTQEHVDGYLAAVDEVFGVMGEALRNGTVASLLKGPLMKRGFYRLT
jgi:glutamate-1-semialdehyde 2,1-aminomutase